MSDKKAENCVECGKKTTAIFEILNIPLCRKCREKNEKYRLITKTRAIKEYCLKEDELYQLEYIETKNPYSSSAPPMNLFLKTQVEELALEKWESLENLEKERTRRTRLGKKIKSAKAKAKKQRKEGLMKALQDAGLEVRSDSELCRAYTKGRTLHTLEEVVEIMKKAHHRHTKTPYDALWEIHRKEIEKDAEEEYYATGNWTDAWNITIGKWRAKIREEAYNG